jgi:hypothetical protein
MNARGLLLPLTRRPQAGQLGPRKTAVAYAALRDMQARLDLRATSCPSNFWERPPEGPGRQLGKSQKYYHWHSDLLFLSAPRTKTSHPLPAAML